MGRRADETPPDSDDPDYEIRKSQRKRDANALQELGVELVALPASELDRLPLPEKLRDAIDLAKRITTHGAMFRQRQYIGKLMRHLDVEPIVAALDAKSAAQAESARSFHRLEQWRDRLISEGEVALDAFVTRYPAANARDLKTLVGKVYAERSQGDAKASTRALFRAVRAAVEAAEAPAQTDTPPAP